MQITDFSKPVSSKKLNESLAQKFGYKLNLEKFTMEQLEDARNKLRTEQHQFETNESYDSVLGDHGYHKNKMFLDVINQEIAEREMNDEEDVEKDKPKAKKKPKNLKEYNEALSDLRHYTRHFSIPEAWTKEARSRLMVEEDADELVNELIVRYDLDEGTATAVVRTLRLTEGEEEKAELIMASKDMVDRVTGWLEDVASMKSEAMLDLLDSIRDEMGSDISSQFEQSVRPALDGIYQALETNRQSLAQAVSILTGSEPPTSAPMAGEEEEALPPEAEAGAEIGGEAAGREMRESVQYSRRLAQILSKKK
jgi:uncharacterized phage infection (PIP) family protein YhgE